MRRSLFLHNGLSPSGALGSTHFDVREGMVTLTAAGLLPGESVTVQVRVEGVLDPGSRTPGQSMGFYWAPLVVSGCAVALSTRNTMQIISVPGTYRIDMSGVTNPASVVVALNEDENMKYGNVVFGHSTNYHCPAEPCPTQPTGVVTSWG